MPPAVLHDEVIDAALATAATLLGMEVVYFGSIDFERNTYRFERVLGDTAQIADGQEIDFTDTFCRRMIDGAPSTTHDASADPIYGFPHVLPEVEVVSYVGVPIHAPDGAIIGTLCGYDSRRVELGDHVVGVLRELAGVIAARIAIKPLDRDVVIRRTPAGWAVGDAGHERSLTEAMVLADLLTEDLAPPARPVRGPAETGEVAQLRTSVAQLEHALAARVIIEQAIGIVAERRRSAPREAFDSLRAVARRSGRRVHDLARDVVRSAHDSDVVLPPELGPAR